MSNFQVQNSSAIMATMCATTMKIVAIYTIKVKIYGTLGKVPEILKPQVIFFLQLRR